MPYSDPIKRREYHRLYSRKYNKSTKRKEYIKAYREKTKELRKEYNHKYYQKRKLEHAVKSKTNRWFEKINIKITDCLCEKCGSPAECFHHFSYYWERFIDGIPVCKQCHMLIHHGKDLTNKKQVV